MQMETERIKRKQARRRKKSRKSRWV